MIVIIPVNGLLNRIRSILSSKLIANILNEKLCVLWIPEKCCNCHYEDIFGNNGLLWDGICSSDIVSFTNKYNIIPDKIPQYFVELYNVCTLRGFIKGEQYFMPQFMASKCELKVIKAGGSFYDPDISKETYNKQKMELYSHIVFNKFIIDNIATIPTKTLGLHLRFTDRMKYVPSSNVIFNTVKKMVYNNSIKNIKIVSDDLDRKGTIMRELQNIFPNINISISDIQDTRRTTARSLQYAMIDWLTLCHCDSLIFFSGSSFGYEAFIWNLNRDVEEIPKRVLLI